jgi:hypothetical protein
MRSARGMSGVPTPIAMPTVQLVSVAQSPPLTNCPFHTFCGARKRTRSLTTSFHTAQCVAVNRVCWYVAHWRWRPFMQANGVAMPMLGTGTAFFTDIGPNETNRSSEVAKTIVDGAAAASVRPVRGSHCLPTRLLLPLSARTVAGGNPSTCDPPTRTHTPLAVP